MAKKAAPKSMIPVRMTGMFLIFFTVFMLLALISYNPADPSFSNYNSAGNIKNIAGIVGSYMADGLFLLFGIAAFFIPVFCTEYALRFLGIRKNANVLNFLSTFIIFFVGLCLLAIVIQEVSIFSVKMKAGGLLGAIIGGSLFEYLNWGSVIILLCLLCTGIMIGYDTSVLYRAMRDFTAKIGEKRELNRIKKEIAKRSVARSIKPIKPRQEPVEAKADANKKEPRITVIEHEDKEVIEIPKQAILDFVDNYQLPPISFLKAPQTKSRGISDKELKANASMIISKLRDFGVDGEILEIKPGPVITMYEFTPAPGIKINKIVSLADDLAMALKAAPVRVVAPIPGKNAVGIEIPNRSREVVYLRKIIASRDFISSSAPLTLALGTNIEGQPITTNLAKMPHLLIAGATGTGKSVGLNTMILSLLYRCDPSELKFIMIDPKRIELSHYEGIPHLLHPVVIDPREALPVLKWAVSEMEMRYECFKELGVKGIDTYNKKIRKAFPHAGPTLATIKKQDEETGTLPMLVIIIDEMADLMMVNREVEVHIARLAQMARAAGIYMIVATQRPSVDVITGLIKANFPARISFRVSSKTDSRTILDSSGADQLLGLGDMLLLSPGISNLRRVHGAYVSEDELDKVVEFIRGQKAPEYINDIDEQIAAISNDQSTSTTKSTDNGFDPKYDEALEFVTNKGSASISLVQRRFKIGYNRAARIIEQMEEDGIIGPPDTAGKPRKVLIKPYAKELEE